jgi:hypothetical protein
VFIAVESIIDDERRTNTLGMLMSLNMLIENGDGFDYSHKDFGEWAHAAGFKRTEVISLTGPTSAAVAISRRSEASVQRADLLAVSPQL